MERILRGKYLVRKSKLSNGQEVLTISGVFYPQNFNIDEVKDNDEMWVSDLVVSSGGIRFTDPIGRDGVSPEDFMSGENHSPSDWNNKNKL